MQSGYSRGPAVHAAVLFWHRGSDHDRAARQRKHCRGGTCGQILRHLLRGCRRFGCCGRYHDFPVSRSARQDRSKAQFLPESVFCSEPGCPVHCLVPPFSGMDHGILHDRSRHACCHRRLSPDPLRHLFLHGLRDHAVRFVTLYGKGLSAAICQLSCCCRQHCPELSSDFRQIWFSRHGNCRRRHRHGDLTVSQSGADVFYGHQAVSPVLSLWGVFLPQSPFQLETICLHPASNTGL